MLSYSIQTNFRVLSIYLLKKAIANVKHNFNEMESSQTERKFVHQKENHPLQEKQKLGALVEKLKKECDKEKKALDGKT